MKILGLKLNKLLNLLKKLPRALAEHLVLSLLFLLIIVIICGGIIFYEYSILGEQRLAGLPRKHLEFKDKFYQEILQIWQEKENRFEKAGLKEYPDFFREVKERVENPPSPSPPLVAKEEKTKEEKNFLPSQEIKKLEESTNLFEFYSIKGEELPSIAERAKIWEEKGLGKSEEYQGLYYQNSELLRELKKELTE